MYKKLSSDVVALMAIEAGFSVDSESLGMFLSFAQQIELYLEQF